LVPRFQAPKESGSGGGFEYQAMFEKTQSLQKQVLKLSEENIELKFEAEQAKKDIPRLKVWCMNGTFLFICRLNRKTSSWHLHITSLYCFE